jgi:hypothetical protein
MQSLPFAGLKGACRLPWKFQDQDLENSFRREREIRWMHGHDKLIALPWALIWLTIIIVHRQSLSIGAIIRSAAHFAIIISPAYASRILGERRYLRFRCAIIACAISAYALHPGGGLARDSIEKQGREVGRLHAAALFARVLIGSRMLFWLILVGGYGMPLECAIPLNTAGIAFIALAKPSHRFCEALQTTATRAMFRSIAQTLPLLSVIPLPKTELAAEADVCNPLVLWMQISLGWIVPTAMQACGEIGARRNFLIRCAHERTSTRQRNADTLQGLIRAHTSSPGVVALLVSINTSMLLWNIMMWHENRKFLR